MKELSIEEKARAYDEALERAKKWYNAPNIDKMPTYGNRVIEEIFPELKESEDERIRKEIIKYLEQTVPHHHRDEVLKSKEWIAWLEKQGEKDSPIQQAYEYGYVEGKRIERKHWLEKQGEQKPTDKVEPKFKVKYAGSEYNVLEVKDIAGVTFYGIEDEPNHIDYVKADNCEIISVYAIKENGSPYPTKPAVFSEKKPKRMISAEAKEAMYDKSAWSEEDELMFLSTIQSIEMTNGAAQLKIDWLKSLKDKYTWKPSIAQLNALSIVSKGNAPDDIEAIVSLYNDLKKLTE